jgi:hypothetical protein
MSHAPVHHAARPASPRARRPRRLIALAATALAAPLPTAPAAHAADAPFRTISRDLGNATTFAFAPIAVATDGREVVGTLGNQAVVRDVAAGVTRPLLSRSASIVAASTDLQRVLLFTGEALDPTDSNGTGDLYLLERATGRTTWLTKQPRVLPSGAPAGISGIADAQISGNGQVVSWRLVLVDVGPRNIIPEYTYSAAYYRFNLATGETAKLGSTPYAKFDTPGATNRYDAIVKHSDTTGRVSVFGDGAIVDGRVVPLPLNPSGDSYVAVSADGRWIAVENPVQDPRLRIVDTTTGAVKEVTPPAWLVDAGYTIRNVTAGGVVVSARFTRAPGVIRDAIGFVSKSTGSVLQIGGDLIANNESSVAAQVSENLAFAANSMVLGKLNASATLPGTEPAASDQPLAKWMPYTDVSCQFGFWGDKQFTRASVSLANAPRGIDPRTPASASVKVFKTSAPSTVYNAFSMAAGTQRGLTVPQNGGWTYAATITFTDGTKASGSVAVPVSGPPICSPFPY